MNPSLLPDGDVVAAISQLWVYPVKSCAGVPLPCVTLTDTGLHLDRAWMVVDTKGDFVTQREMPRMALIQPQIGDTALLLHAPGRASLRLDFDAPGALTTVQVWEDRVDAFDMGEAAARWFSGFLMGEKGLGAPSLRLVRFDPVSPRLASLKWTQGLQALNQFSDGYPLLLLSEASLAELNQRLTAQGHGAVGVERFRPNVVLTGLQAHDEDRLSVLRIGAQPAVALKPVKPCARCPIPNIDPSTALSSPEVGDTLQAYRQDQRLSGAVTFGMNCITLSGVGSVLRVGQRVAADFDFG